MRKRLYGRILPALTLLITTQFALADSTRARCDIYPAGSDHASASIACTFSQNQGTVYIDRSDGVSHELLPTGDVPGNFEEQVATFATNAEIAELAIGNSRFGIGIIMVMAGFVGVWGCLCLINGIVQSQSMQELARAISTAFTRI